jgi:[acyl-carrier-protein] S-malonyltransferase
MTKIAVVFPGQGSQSIGMMAGWDDHPAVRATFDEASDALGDDLWALVTDGPADALNLTTNTQPVMLTAGVAAWRAWQAAGGAMPDVVAGHSLGEYAALVAAGALAFRDAVPLVRFRAQAMQEAVPQGVGAMAAILGGDDAAIAEACREAAQGEVVEPVNFNSPGQIVIAGHRAAVERAIEAAKARGAKRGMLLPVSAPFHSSLLKPAAERLATRLAQVEFAVDPRHPQRRRRRAPDARRDPRGAREAGGEPGALDRDRARDRGARRHRRDRGRARARARGARAQDRAVAQGPRADGWPRARRREGGAGGLRRGEIRWRHGSSKGRLRW